MAKWLVLVAVVAVAGVLVVRSVTAGVDRHGASVVRFSIDSQYVDRTLKEVAVVPPGNARRPLLVFLHGRGLKPAQFFGNAVYRELARLGDRAPVVVALDGGDHSYWHDRRGARWGSYVLREAIPAAVKRLHADPDRIAIGGISMGGFGAFDLARRAGRRFCAVGGHSPAFWLRAGDSAPGAFDDAADFARHDVYAFVRSRRRPYGSTPLWIDRGTRDPFASADVEVVRALKRSGASVTSRVWPGEHDWDYWHAHTASYLRFYARAIERC